jgi:hypothetical protein
MRKYGLLILVFFLLTACQAQKLPVDEEKPEDEIIDEMPEEIPEEIEEDFLRSYLNGSRVDDQTVKAVMVMIENTDAARPHSGISVADIVYEVAMDKYATTRFLAIFSSNLPDKVGPVRSARIPFVTLAKQWMLPFAHYGAAKTGEGDAYSIIHAIRWPVRFDGVSGLNDDWYFRDNKRYAPHNAFFDANEASMKMPDISLSRGFLFSEEAVVGVSGKSLSLDIVASVKVNYVYDESTRKYLRFINTKPMMDVMNDSQVTVSNIIVLTAPHSTVTSTQYVLVDFAKGGDILVFSGGMVRKGMWKMSDSMIEYLDENLQPIVLLPGNTWIQVVSPSMKVVYE